MQRLRPDKAQALLPVFSVSPACDDTDNSNKRCQSDPIHRHGCLGEARVRNAKECKNQHQEVGPLPCEKCARVEAPSIRCGIVRLRVSHRSRSQIVKTIEHIAITLRAPDQTGEQSDVIRPSSYSNAKMRFQSFFMLTIIQSCFFAMSYIACLKVPTLVSRVESDGSCRWGSSSSPSDTPDAVANCCSSGSSAFPWPGRSRSCLASAAVETPGTFAGAAPRSPALEPGRTRARRTI
jgi:hypothetical protein